MSEAENRSPRLKIKIPSWKSTTEAENRKKKIADDLDEAQKFKNDAEKKLIEYKKIIEQSKKEAQKIILENKKKLDNDITNKRKNFEKEVENELSNIEKQIQNFKKTSISEINKVAFEISSYIIKQIVGTEVNASNVTAIVEDVTKRRLKDYQWL